MITFILLSSIVLNAIADGMRKRALKDKNNRILGPIYHILYMLFIGTLLLLFVTPAILPISELYSIANNPIRNILLLIAGYSLVRFGIFNYIVNVVAGDHYLYIGDENFLDRLLRQWFPTATALIGYILLTMISLIGGLYILQRILI